MPERHEDVPEVRVVHWPGGSLYAMLFGDGEAGRFLLTALGLRRRDVGRYRDAWLERSPDGDPWIAVYTRLGGRNRGEYPPEIRLLQHHDQYVADRDDTFDDTYATFYFKLPPALASALDAELPDWRDHLGPTRDMNQVWREALDALASEDQDDA